MPIVWAVWYWWLSPGSLQKHHSGRWGFSECGLPKAEVELLEVNLVLKKNFPRIYETVLPISYFPSFVFINKEGRGIIAVAFSDVKNREDTLTKTKRLQLHDKNLGYNRRSHVVPAALLIRSTVVCRKTGCSLVKSICDQLRYKVNLPPRGLQATDTNLLCIMT